MTAEPTELRARATARQIWAVSLPIIFAAVSEAIGAVVESLDGTALLDSLHVTRYYSRRLEEFQVVADRVEAAALRPWHS